MHLSSERIPSVCEYSGDFAYLLELKDMLFLLGFLYRVYFFFFTEVMAIWTLRTLWNENPFMFILVYQTCNSLQHLANQCLTKIQMVRNIRNSRHILTTRKVRQRYTKEASSHICQV